MSKVVALQGKGGRRGILKKKGRAGEQLERREQKRGLGITHRSTGKWGKARREEGLVITGLRKGRGRRELPHQEGYL